MPASLYLALKQLFPSGRGVSVFALLAIVGVALGVMVLVVVQSVMSGFGAEIRSKLQATSGDIRVVNGGIIDDPERLIAELRARPEVAAVVPYAEGIVMLQHESRPEFPMIHGYDVLAPIPVLPLEDFLLSGRPEDLDDGRTFLGRGLAAALLARPDSVVEVFTPLMLEALNRDTVLLPREFEVAGIFESGYHAVDVRTMVVTLRAMQDLYGLGDGVHGIALNLKPGFEPALVARDLNAVLLAPLRATTWMDQHSQFLFVLAFEKGAMFFVNLAIVLVASFCISIALYSTVLRKVREIGLLGAMGARRGLITSIYVWQGLVVGNTGALVGFSAAFTLLYFRRGIVELVLDQATILTFYNFLEFPVRYQIADLVMVYLMTLTLATLAGFIPALFASSRRPADALRAE